MLHRRPPGAGRGHGLQHAEEGEGEGSSDGDPGMGPAVAARPGLWLPGEATLMGEGEGGGQKGTRREERALPSSCCPPGGCGKRRAETGGSRGAEVSCVWDETHECQKCSEKHLVLFFFSISPIINSLGAAEGAAAQPGGPPHQEALRVLSAMTSSRQPGTALGCLVSLGPTAQPLRTALYLRSSSSETGGRGGALASNPPGCTGSFPPG